MTTMTISSPKPLLSDPSILKPSRSFRKSILGMIGAIGLFVLVYILLFISALIIASAMVALGYIVVVTVHHFMTIVLGVGLLLSALMLVFFLIKFLFKKPVPATRGQEISEAEQPLLFSFIRQITTETNVPFPKHIYLLPDVNASVFFDSSFWSMFFPVKKNLNIGLGLVNALNQSEFKAVLAHEFGHFSQRSMRFGSYVYNLNKILYNLLYDNDDYHKMLNAWGRGHRMLRFAAILNLKIVECIQHILQKMYVVVNKKYMALSREMEFHADTVAATISGSNNVITQLHKLEIAGESYDKLLKYWDSKLSENLRAENLYPQHLIVQKNYAIAQGLTIDKNEMPVIEKGPSPSKKQRLIINSVWQSHPLVDDREHAVNKYSIWVEPVLESAWSLFNNAEALQIAFTNDLYTKAGITIKNEPVNVATFKEDFESKLKTHIFHPDYKGYYEFKQIKEFEIDDLVTVAPASAQKSFQELFTTENSELPQRIQNMEEDIKTLEYVSINGKNDIKTFDYLGISYTSKDADRVIETIEGEIAAAKADMDKFDKDIFTFFYSCANTAELKQQLVEKYRKLFLVDKTVLIEYDLYNDIIADVSLLYQKMTINKIYDTVNSIYAKEKKLKPRLQALLKEDELLLFIKRQYKTDIEKYAWEKFVYFDDPKYDNGALKILRNALQAYVSIISAYSFDAKKDLLDFQLTLIH